MISFLSIKFQSIDMSTHDIIILCKVIFSPRLYHNHFSWWLARVTSKTLGDELHVSRRTLIDNPNRVTTGVPGLFSCTSARLTYGVGVTSPFVCTADPRRSLIAVAINRRRCRGVYGCSA